MKRYIGVVLAVMLFAFGCSKKQAEQSATDNEQNSPQQEQGKAQPGILRIERQMLRDLKITTAQVEERRGGVGVALLGELQVNENAYAEIGPPIASRVVEINAALGETVSSGQVLAVLQSTELGKARSDLITAKAHAELTQQVLARKRRLLSEHIAAQREVEEAEANASAADAELRAARSTVQAFGVDIEESRGAQYPLRSSIAGVVIERTAIRGQMSDPAKPLFKVAQMGDLWLMLQAFERDAVRLKIGAPVRVTFAALPGKSFNGNVVNIGRQVSPESRTIAVRVEVQNEGGQLRPGMAATAWVGPGDSATALLTVPTASLQRLSDTWIVFLPHSEAEFEIRSVGRGRDLGAEVEVVSGLRPGETVVVEGAFLLKAEAERSRGEGEHEH